MFGWFAPRSPLTTWEKTWTEFRMCWLAEHLGLERLQQARLILPTDTFFARNEKATLERAQALLRWLGDAMGVATNAIELRVCPDTQVPNAAGLYQQQGEAALILVAESQLHDVEALTATLAHELAHELAVRKNLPMSSMSDFEWIIDLIPVFLGIGLFGANAVIREYIVRHTYLTWWSIRRQGYLPARIIGYALALFCFGRGETTIDWLRYLRKDAAYPLRQGLRYLRKTGDSLFRPQALGTASVPLTVEQAVERLLKGTLTFRLATLWEIEQRSWSEPALMAPVLAGLNENDADVRFASVCVLRHFPEGVELALPTLLRRLHFDNNLNVRQEIAITLGSPVLKAADVVPELTVLLGEEEATLRWAATVALRTFGLAAEQASKPLLGTLTKALLERQEYLIEEALHTLARIVPNPRERLRDSLGRDDKALHQEAQERLCEYTQASTESC
jgi:hypothetical protein